EWNAKEQLLQRKLKSLAIANTEADATLVESELSQLQKEADSLRSRLDEAQRMYYSLQHAEWRDKREKAASRFDQLRQQMNRIEQSEEERRLEEHWERNGGELRSVYRRKEEELERQLLHWEAVYGRGKEELEEKRKQRDRLDREIHKWE